MSCARKGIEMKITKLKGKRNNCDDFRVVGFTSSYLALCHQEIRRFFHLPNSAKVIFIEIHDRPAKDRLAIRIVGHMDHVELKSMEKKRPVHIRTLPEQEKWLHRRLKFDKTYFAGLWYEED